ncbi:hypothetical protein [Roseimarinus sediminis]|uniref:hypothetical protein n=1 Tax=Roseimarinus sediminis TaxID=1610899 RepID=UPI003D2349F5
MKKLVIIITVFMSISLSSLAQVNPHAIGLRFGGDGNINGAEISYQQAFGDVNRLELDLGFKGYRNYNDMFVAGIYHWVWNLTLMNWEPRYLLVWMPDQ